MVISADEKKILLERLQKARETKAAKAAEAKKAKAAKETPASVKEPEPPAPAPVPEPAPAPVPAPAPQPPAPEPMLVPEVPDLVAMSRKKPAKKKCLIPSSDEDSDSETELPPKKGKGGKKQAYMKIKIYKEPKNAAAFQSLVEAIQDEQPEPEPEVLPPPASASIGRGCKFDIKNKTPAQSRTLPSPQEMMRRAALEFFS